MDHNASPVDLESLLWDMRDLIRNLSQVAKAQAAEIERLGGRSIPVSFESDALLAACDTVLAQWAEQESDGASAHYEPYDVAAWVKNINIARGEGDEPRHDDDVQLKVPTPTANLAVNASKTIPTEVPSDFWNVHAFKWEDEPLVLDEQIPELWLDGSSDDSSSNSGSSTARDDGATLFHPDEQVAVPKSGAADSLESADKVTRLAAVRRHTLLGNQHLRSSLALKFAQLNLDQLETIDSGFKQLQSNPHSAFSFDFIDSISEDNPLGQDDLHPSSPAAANTFVRRPPAFHRRLSAPELPRWRFAVALDDDHARKD